MQKKEYVTVGLESFFWVKEVCMTSLSVPVKFVGVWAKRLAKHEEMKLPAYVTSGSVGLDLEAAIEEPLTLAPTKRVLVPTGIALALPFGYEAQVRSRSGLALKHGLQVLNSPGTIDQDYRGEVGVILINHGETTFVIQPGMRVAQLVVAPVVKASLKHVPELQAEDERNDQGFGSTGL